MNIECLNCGKSLDVRDIADMTPEEVNEKILRADVCVTDDAKTTAFCLACAHALVSVFTAAAQWVRPGNIYSLAMRMANATARMERLCETPEPTPGLVALARCIGMLGGIENELTRAESGQPYVLTEGERAYLDEARTIARNAAILHDANHDCREAQR